MKIPRTLTLGAIAVSGLALAISIDALSGAPFASEQPALEPYQYDLSLRKIKNAAEDLDAAAREYKEKTAAFDRKWAPHKGKRCYYRDPSECVWLDQLQAQQDRELKILNADIDRLNARISLASSTINIQKGILHARLFLGCLHLFEPKIRECAEIPEPKLAAACMIRVWEEHC